MAKIKIAAAILELELRGFRMTAQQLRDILQRSKPEAR
jgi:hypothetical protein